MIAPLSCNRDPADRRARAVAAAISRLEKAAMNG